MTVTPGCGERDTGPCQITVGTRTFSTLQAAINAAPNGASLSAPTRILVQGKCVGPPVLIQGRSNLSIEGVAPTLSGITPPPVNGCREMGPLADDLTATVASDHSLPVSGTNGEEIGRAHV